MTSQLSDLKSQHIATEVTARDNETKKSASDILKFENTVNKNERGISFVRGFFFYTDQSYLVYECKSFSFNYTTSKVNKWKSTGLHNFNSNSHMDAVAVSKNDLPKLNDDGRLSVKFDGGYFKQTILFKPNNNKVINVYIVYKLFPISIFRSDTYTVQNALFGGVKITKNATDTSKHKYAGYGICFDEGGTFSMGNINNGRNVLIFGVHENSVIHSNNKANNIFIMGDGFVQGINDTTLYAEKIYSKNFTAADQKFVLSLHYNGDDSYLFVNGKQELKFKAKDEQIVKEKLCLSNISDDWTSANAEKTGLYGNIYDFVVDYEAIIGVKAIYDMHRYLMIKHNISP